MDNFKIKCFFIDNMLDKLFKKYEFNLKDKKTTLIFFKKLKKYLLYLHKLENKDINIKKFKKNINEIILASYLFEKKIGSLIIRKEIRKLFRFVISEYIFKSPIIKRSYKKPRGYPGDYLIFEMIYNYSLTPKGIGYYLDLWVLEYELTKGMIYRKNRIKKMLKELIKNSKNKLNIMNIGCGSSREIRELISDTKIDFNNVTFTCVDQDEAALNFSKKSINKIKPDLNISFLKHEMLNIILNREKKISNMQDVIYSLGVADYFLKTTFENFIKFCYSLLKPKGILIIPLCSSHNPKLYIPLKWFCEWDFYSHKADDIKNFIRNDLHIKKVEIFWQKRVPVFFIVIRK
ncbi:MAG: class I SAM-dependent methyltransferase [Candidatus Firestonebacteria bacterium]|nr:class I SAM-dependent methyltransferase [Candidatus Firestonebacteria bacterium]